MKQLEGTLSFEEQLRRIRLVTSTATEDELARYFGIPLSDIEEARLCGQIPSDWLVLLTRVEYVLPEWILTGRGECYTFDIMDRYETLGENAAARQADKETLMRLPSNMLAHELARRIAIAEQSAFVRRAQKSPWQHETGGAS